MVVDSWASETDAKHEYGVDLVELNTVKGVDCIVLAVAHDEFRKMELVELDKLFCNMPGDEKVIIDVKGRSIEMCRIRK